MAKILTLLSGKGGSGKTVITLSIATLLAKIGKKVLIIDCDTSTHGATYFFEELISNSNNVTSLQLIANTSVSRFIPVKVSPNLYFIPSSIDTSKTAYKEISNISTAVVTSKPSYDYILFDCQAGFSELTNELLKISDKNLIVMEADSISASSIRVLFLQLGSKLNTVNTYQVFNKLSDAERLIYDKITGGTIFPNLPAIPFDWGVRAAFSLGKIPTINTKESAFGLGVIRLSKLLFPTIESELQKYEESIVGNWFNDIQQNLINLQIERDFLSQNNTKYRRKVYEKQMISISLIIGTISTAIGGLTIFKDYINLSSIYNIGITGLISISGLLVSLILVLRTKTQLKQDELQDSNETKIKTIENEIEKYKTLIETDPRLKEYYSQTLISNSIVE